MKEVKNAAEKVIDMKIEKKKKKARKKMRRRIRSFLGTVIVLCVGVYIGRHWEEVKELAQDKAMPKIEELKKRIPYDRF